MQFQNLRARMTAPFGAVVKDQHPLAQREFDTSRGFGKHESLTLPL